MFLLLLALLQPPGAQACTAAPGAPWLDHVVLATADLEGLTRRLGGWGFRFKPGHLHADSLLTRHIKFPDRSGLELMTLAGAPTSAMARGYARRIASGDQGAFAALAGSNPTQVRALARQLGFAAAITASGGWVFASFPDTTDAGAVFFAEGPAAPRDADSLIRHGNGATALAAAWIEAGPLLGELLRGLGGRRCGSVRLPDGRRGERWGLARGTVVLVASRDPAAPPRVVGVELSRGGHPGAPAATTQLLPGFWVAWR